MRIKWVKWDSNLQINWEEYSKSLKVFTIYQEIKSRITTLLLGSLDISIQQIYATFIRLDVLYFLPMISFLS